jgi:hypothetical protein
MSYSFGIAIVVLVILQHPDHELGIDRRPANIPTRKRGGDCGSTSPRSFVEHVDVRELVHPPTIHRQHLCRSSSKWQNEPKFNFQ